MVSAINGALWPPWKEGNTLSQECNPRTLKTASVCRDETPNTLGVLGFFFFLIAYSAATEDPWKCRERTTQAIKCPDSLGERQEHRANELRAECLQQTDMR